MTSICQLSNNTKTYLSKYESILKEMIRNMSSAEQTDSISDSFITQMIPHHCAAIAMSENLLCYTTNIPLQNIALNIISSQQESIENMVRIYKRCALYRNDPTALYSYQNENSVILNRMFYEMNSAYISNNIDVNFMREMIPHHRGAVSMSKHALCFPLCRELVPLLQSIILSQEEGIKKMNQLLHSENIL